MRTVLCDMLGIRHPIIQDGMGPFSTAALAAAVSDAGGLGTVSIPGMLLEPAEAERLMRAEIDRTASLTDRGFAGPTRRLEATWRAIDGPVGLVDVLGRLAAEAIDAARGRTELLLITDRSFVSWRAMRSR